MSQVDDAVPAGFLLDPDSSAHLVVYHRDGVPWYEAPIPRRWHRCQIQTWGYDQLAWRTMIVHRCACGATRFTGFDVWIDRNTRRKR